ncbi:ATP-grasp domain-containing protein [Deinococcus roseus]|uniref:ATP-grasp domain-containing protein n=1 Tax=Deinococcus roseus TaxID=392414 RepID=A0ABQ2D3T9_9DEIO|nr:hypothetical protein [Deinococcus roseus]GGJ45179.1 hypothetical protein GCM10008938_34310 [Deinococcus roseus]
MRVAFVTHEQLEGLAPDDQAILEFLQPEAAVWNDPEVRWQDFDAVVLRSTWDYHLHYAHFQTWLKHLQNLNVKVLNSARLVQWNSNKIYLQELQNRGIPIIPTHFVDPHERQNLPEILSRTGWSGLVIKPSVSAAAHHTYRIQGALPPEIHQTLLDLPADVTLLVQPFMREIQNPGEHSLVFFNGQFSHALLKTPGQGDFRVQGMHGGQTRGIEVDSDLIRQAQNVIQALPEMPLYARVDGVVGEGQLLLMEIELIEPNLFLKTHPEAARNFAQAIQERLDGKQHGSPLTETAR